MTTNSEDQIILIDKPAGISSFGVVAKVRGKLKTEFGHKVKVGHTGTLDPFATGLLILLTGKMTKKSTEFLKLDKVYEATLKLGYTSSTGDPEGEIIKYQIPQDTLSMNIIADGIITKRPKFMTTDLRKYSEKDVSLVLNHFIGKIVQTPPKFSAIKINGQRAYKLARQGKNFEIPTREVEIYSLDILEYNYPKLKIRCHVSSGTYIRTLAKDIGQKLGTGAYLTELRRTKIGNYNLKNASTLSNFTKSN